MADDLAATTLLASDKPILIAPAMNALMWAHPATQANLATLAARGVRRVGPERRRSRLRRGRARAAWPSRPKSSPRSSAALAATGRLAGRRALVTSGPTREPIDPVRYISNHSSGKQGHAIAAALAALGAETILVSGPTQEPTPAGVKLVAVESAAEMLAATEATLPVDVAVMAAAVSDWRVEAVASQKLKKNGKGPPALRLTENPDILATVARRGNDRPALVVGFAAETENVVANAKAKRAAQGLRLDPRQRRGARHRHLRRRQQHDPSGRRGRRRGLAGDDQAARSPPGSPSGSPRHSPRAERAPL